MAFQQYANLTHFLIKTRGGLRSMIQIKNERAMQQGAQ